MGELDSRDSRHCTHSMALRGELQCAVPLTSERGAVEGQL